MMKSLWRDLDAETLFHAKGPQVEGAYEWMALWAIVLVCFLLCRHRRGLNEQ